MALRRHDEVRGEARAREREKSRGGAEVDVDGHTCCRSMWAAGVHPGGAKVAGCSGDDGDAEAEDEDEDEGSSCFCPPRGDDSPAHTRPTRVASQRNEGRRARGRPRRGLADLANAVPSSSSSAAGDDDDDPFLPAGFVSARPSSERERERGGEREREGCNSV
uniref:Uncharacterized protein n=1 Tax=Oryza sativa subsp. japonica TaxID=39947 RepID=Q69T07_ORYSJ|nr:hypothetical protein [Oryza sativa Japonica Group]BAD35925.1 hypothetical protein [Oryza sativa Japonica Group]